MAFADFLSPVLSPLLSATGPFWTILIVSLFVSLLTSIVIKYTTDQKKMRKIKADLKRLQRKARETQKTDPEAAMAVQKDMMRLNGDYMKMSLKATLYTFIPVILFFGWLSAYLAFAPLVPNQGFDITVQVTPGTTGMITLELPEGFTSNTNLTKEIEDERVSWRVSASTAGNQVLGISHESGEEFLLPIEISDEQNRFVPLRPVNGAALQSVTIEYQKLLVFENVFMFKDIPWLKNWGWLGAYLFFSLAFSLSLKRLFDLA